MEKLIQKPLTPSTLTIPQATGSVEDLAAPSVRVSDTEVQPMHSTEDASPAITTNPTTIKSLQPESSQSVSAPPEPVGNTPKTPT